MTEQADPATRAAPTFDDAVALLTEYAGDTCLASGETAVAHALGTARTVEKLNVDRPAVLASVLFPAALLESDAQARIVKEFGDETAGLVADVRELLRLGQIGQRGASGAPAAGRDADVQRRAQAEALRKMLLALARDIRAVLIRLASRVQTLRYHATAKTQPHEGMARETLDIYAPLANRLGIWELKWELEDLAFRFEDPATYKRIARLLDEKRAEREEYVARAIEELRRQLASAGVSAEVSGRPKHIYSIWRKMRGKGVDFSELYDVQAFRVIVDDVRACYAVLGIVHNLWQPIPREFDDYISRPKPNGYKSLHTVVIGEDGRAFEVQIRTHEMHHFAEYGVAAHWRYKEAGAKGYTGHAMANGQYDEKIAWLRQLLAWKDDVSGSDNDGAPGDAQASPWDQLKHASLDDQIYVLTPQARVVALPIGATPVDFAYQVHTELGHRCRGARVDGAMVPLNTPLANGQTVEIVAVKQGGPSRDWLNPQLGYLHSARAKAKVRAWFNTFELDQQVAAGRALVEKTLQREGKTSVNLDDLSLRLGFKSPEDLFVAVGKEAFSLRQIEHALTGTPQPEPADLAPPLIARKSSGLNVNRGAASGVLVLGVDALMMQMARCCRPAPPDPIAAFVTQGKGVSIHRADCAGLARLARRTPERVLDAAWSADVLEGHGTALYPVDIAIEALDRQGLLRDISEVFARQKINVIGVRSASHRDTALMNFTVEVGSAAQIQRATALLLEIPGVSSARRRE